MLGKWIDTVHTVFTKIYKFYTLKQKKTKNCQQKTVFAALCETHNIALCGSTPGNKNCEF